MRVSHRALDPRAKLALTSAIAITTLLVPDLRALGLLALILTIVVLTAHDYSVMVWLYSLSPFKYLIPIILVLNAIFYNGGTPLASWSLVWIDLTVTTGGLYVSGVIAGRLLVIAAAAAWFSATTDPELFEAALVRLGIPWSFAFLCSLTLRLVPELRNRFRMIEEAQYARGLSTEGGPIRRVRSKIPMLIPFFVSVIQYGYELSEALTVRKYGASPTRSSIIELQHHPNDYVLYIGALVVVIGFYGFFA